MKLNLLFFIILFSACNSTNNNAIINSNNFVKVKGTQFIKNGKPYFYVGANFWAGMNLGVANNTGNKQRLLRELDAMQKLGINNLRIMALTEGPNTEPYRIVPANNNNTILNDTILKGLDFLLSEMSKRNMVAVVCLSNFWPWSGGFAQYQKWSGDIAQIDYPMDTSKINDWGLYMKNTAKFYSSAIAKKIYNNAIAQIINRKNTLNNLLYKNDATIMSWQLCNEPRGMQNVKDYLIWVNETASYIKSIDTNHLVSVGSEGNTPDTIHNGTPFIATHQSKNIDYTTAHLWIQNWDWYNPKKHSQTYTIAKANAINYITQHCNLAYQLQKPFVLEEFGIMKDSGSYLPTATNYNRDAYYETVFELVYKNALNGKANGVNFWAWSGEGRPKSLACWWHTGDDFTGDPPHELQGWYSVYNTDTSTHKVIKKYADLMQHIQ